MSVRLSAPIMLYRLRTPPSAHPVKRPLNVPVQPAPTATSAGCLALQDALQLAPPGALDVLDQAPVHCCVGPRQDGPAAGLYRHPLLLAHRTWASDGRTLRLAAASHGARDGAALHGASLSVPASAAR